MFHRKAISEFLPVVILSIINIIIFYRYYLGEYGFPWDFNIGYFGFVAYWTTSVRLGVFPDWVPFAGAGYPLLLNPQSYFSYPVFWIITLLKIPYSMNVAVVIQCLHFLFGAIGTYVFTYALSKDKRVGIFFGIAYTFFGGFFSHAEHPDIVRGYAIIPWILWATSFDGEVKLLPRHFFIPFFISLLCTGVYPGVMISTLFISAIIIFLNVIFLHGVRKFKDFMILASGCLLGLILSTSHLAPIFIFGDYLQRAYGDITVLRGGWKFSSLITLISGWESKLLPEDISMRGLYLGSATLFIIFVFSKPFARSALSYIIAFLISLSMILGDGSLIYKTITSVFSPLRLSRFPSADYKAFILLTLFGVCASTINLVSEVSTKVIIIRIFLLVLFLNIILFFAPISLSNAELALALASILVPLGFLLFYKQNLSLTLYVAILFCFINGFILVRQNRTSWETKLPDYSELLNQTSGEFKVADRIISPPISRPQRVSGQNDIVESFLGYLLGAYYFNDHTGFRLKSKFEVEKSPSLKDFILEPWKGILTASSKINCDSPSSSNDTTIGNIIQTSYSADEASFAVNIVNDAYFIENETFFPGWKAELPNQYSGEALQFCSGLRGYKIPAGNYKFRTKFDFPMRLLFFGITGICWVGYIVFLLVVFKKYIKSISY